MRAPLLAAFAYVIGVVTVSSGHAQHGWDTALSLGLRYRF